MPSPQEIQRLRSELGDKTAMETLYGQDTSFRATVDKYRGVMTNMSPVAEVKFPTAMLNKHYQKSFSPTKQVSPTTLAMANTAAAMGRQNQETAEKQSLLQYAGETLGNVPGSAWNYAKGLGSAVKNVFNPDMQQNTLANVARLGVGTAINAAETLTGNENLVQDGFGEDLATKAGQYIVQRYGSLDQAAETLKTDPIGFLSDVSTVVTGAGGALNVAGKAAGLSGLAQAGAKVAKVGFKAEPFMVAGKVAQKGAQGVGFGLRQMTGLNPETIATIVNNTDDFAAAQKGLITRQTVAEKVLKGTQSKMDDFSDVGKMYETMRTGKQVAKAPGSFFEDFLTKKGIRASQGDDGLKVKLQTDIDTSIPITKSELSELEDFINTVRGRETFTDSQVLNVRQRLTQMSKFDAAKSDAFRSLAKDMRKEWNKVARPQIKGLEDLDNQYSPLVEEIGNLKKDFIDVGPDGTAVLKDSALSKIANLTKKGNEAKLARVQELIPDIADEINAVKALEDVQLSNGQKVGTYFRAGVGGAGIATGNPMAIVATILTTPSIAIPVLKFYGRAKRVPQNVISGILSKLQKGEKLSPEQAVIMSNALDHAEDLNAPKGAMAQMGDATQAIADDLDDVPLSQMSPQGMADAAASQKVLDAGGSLDDAMKAAETAPKNKK